MVSDVINPVNVLQSDKEHVRSVSATRHVGTCPQGGAGWICVSGGQEHRCGKKGNKVMCGVY